MSTLRSHNDSTALYRPAQVSRRAEHGVLRPGAGRPPHQRRRAPRLATSHPRAGSADHAVVTWLGPGSGGVFHALHAVHSLQRAGGTAGHGETRGNTQVHIGGVHG